MAEIIRIEDEINDGLYSRDILGLTLFSNNDVEDETGDTMVTFLRALVETYPCAAHIGLLSLEGDDPHEVFAPLREGTDYIRSHVDSYSHGGVWVDRDKPAGCFFPRFDSALFSVIADDERLIDYLLGYDQPFLYVNVDDAICAALLELHRQPPFSVEGVLGDKWWRAVTTIAPLGLWGGNDESRFHAHCRKPEYFHQLDVPLERTCSAIRATPWFQAHQHELRWPTEEEHFPFWYDSLLLPEVIEHEKEREVIRQENLRKMQAENS